MLVDEKRLLIDMIPDPPFTTHCCDLSDPHSSAALDLIATVRNCYVPVVTTPAAQELFVT